MQAIAEIVCALKDRDGRILIPGFYDRVLPPSPKERDAWARLPFDEKDYTEKEMGARELVGEPGVPLFERVVGAADARGPRHPRRIHRRRREDRDSRARRRQDQPAPGGRSASR